MTQRIGVTIENGDKHYSMSVGCGFFFSQSICDGIWKIEYNGLVLNINYYKITANKGKLESTQSKVIKVTKAPSLLEGCSYLIELTGELVEKMLSLVSFRAGLDPQEYKWINTLSTEELVYHIFEQNKERVAKTVAIMMTENVRMDTLGDAIETRIIQGSALDTLFQDPHAIELKYYMLSLLVQKIKEAGSLGK